MNKLIGVRITPQRQVARQVMDPLELCSQVTNFCGEGGRRHRQVPEATVNMGESQHRLVYASAAHRASGPRSTKLGRNCTSCLGIFRSG